MRMPVLFVGHGSPMNAIEKNRWSTAWDCLASRVAALPERPRAVLAVSAHWAARGFRVSDAGQNRQIYDMYGFPEPLYQLRYEPSGQPEVARRAQELAAAGGVSLRADQSWGIDHGVWSVLAHVVPDADVPVVMASVDPTTGPLDHLALGRALAPLRDEGVLILASGNVVHNLRLCRFDAQGGFPWAERFDAAVCDAVAPGDAGTLPDAAGKDAAALLTPGSPFAADACKAAESPEHLWPLFVALGAARAGEPVEVFNEGCEAGALSMTSYAFGLPGGTELI